MSIAIALDGPAGAGKSSIAKRVAKALDCIYVDTGALYRTIGLSATRNSVAPEDENAVKNLLSKITVDLTFNEKGEQIVLLDNEDDKGVLLRQHRENLPRVPVACDALRHFNGKFISKSHDSEKLPLFFRKGIDHGGGKRWRRC